MERRALWILAVAALGAAACAEDDKPSEPTLLLRVGTSHGLGELAPGPSRVGGAAYYARELLYEPVSAYADVRGVEGRGVVLSPRDAKGAEVLVRALEHEGLEETEILDGDVVARFTSKTRAEKAARAFRSDKPTVATGPFRLVSAQGTLRFEAREDDPSISEMEIHSLPTTELWRRLHGGDIDVIPVLDEAHREQFEGMHSVRTLDLPVSGYLSLIFNTRRAELSHRAVRRHIAAALDRDAIARVACGTADCKADLWVGDELEGDGNAGGDIELPAELDLFVLESDSAAVRAAEVIRHQLRPAGVGVRIHRAPLGDLLERGQLDYDALLVPIPSVLARVLSYLDDVTVHPERYRAVRRSGEVDTEALRRVLASEMPAIPLYEGRHFAAIDARFCGGDPRGAASWAWLADLRRCEVAAR